MKRFARYVTCTVVLACIACGCSGDLDIKQDYGFEVTCLPVPKKIREGETVEIRLQIVRQGYFSQTRYRLRWFQPDGQGSLAFEDGTVLSVNDYYPVREDDFRMYYTSRSQERQVFTLYSFDNMGNSHTLEFSFAYDGTQG